MRDLSVAFQSAVDNPDGVNYQIRLLVRRNRSFVEAADLTDQSPAFADPAGIVSNLIPQAVDLQDNLITVFNHGGALKYISSGSASAGIVDVSQSLKHQSGPGIKAGYSQLSSHGWNYLERRLRLRSGYVWKYWLSY